MSNGTPSIQTAAFMNKLPIISFRQTSFPSRSFYDAWNTSLKDSPACRQTTLHPRNPQIGNFLSAISRSPTVRHQLEVNHIHIHSRSLSVRPLPSAKCPSVSRIPGTGASSVFSSLLRCVRSRKMTTFLSRLFPCGEDLRGQDGVETRYVDGRGKSQRPKRLKEGTKYVGWQNREVSWMRNVILRWCTTVHYCTVKSFPPCHRASAVNSYLFGRSRNPLNVLVSFLGPQ